MFINILIYPFHPLQNYWAVLGDTEFRGEGTELHGELFVRVFYQFYGLVFYLFSILYFLHQKP
jgi:hypothetical protein